jgi:hypothetical protein
MTGLHEIDEKKKRSYELSVYSDKAAAAGDIEQARKLMHEAASLNAAYSVRAAFVGSKDPRKVRLSPTVRKVLLPTILGAGFESVPEGPWKEGARLERRRGGVTHQLYMGRSKFGGRFSIDVARFTSAADVECFDWHRLNMRDGDLAFRTQEEVEAVCARWKEILESEVFPWLDGERP